MEHLREKLALAASKLEMATLDNNQVEVVCREDQDYIDKINKLHHYIDTVKKMVKPGCSEQVLKVALDYMSSLVNILSSMSLTAKLHASL